MQLKKNYSLVFTGTCLAFSLLLLSACSQKMNFATSSVAPAARGYVKVKKDKVQDFEKIFWDPAREL